MTSNGKVIILGSGAVLALLLFIVVLYGIYPGEDAGVSRENEKSADVQVPPDIQPLTDVDPMPSFNELKAGPERKGAFIDYVAPIVRSVNSELRQRRDSVLLLERSLEQQGELGQPARNWLDQMVLRYRVKASEPQERIDELREKVDIVPVSLAVAQAALESNWGTSRFARQGNNLFGKWCFTEGCGIVPARRAEGASHEVAAYDNVAEATRDYMHHLNSHPVYEPMRERRAAARAADRRPEGADLAAGLEKYSAKGKEYVRYVRQVISANDLDELEGAKP